MNPDWYESAFDAWSREVRLTPAAARLLQRVRSEGVVKVNGRLFKQAKALKDGGLASVDFDLIIPSRGASLWVITLSSIEGG